MKTIKNKKKAFAFLGTALMLLITMLFTACKQPVSSSGGAGSGGGSTAPGEIIIGIGAREIIWNDPSDYSFVTYAKFKTKAGQSWAQLKAEAETKLKAKFIEDTMYALTGEWYRDKSKWEGGTLLTDSFVFTKSINIYPVLTRKDITVTVALAAGETHLSLADPANPAFTMAAMWRQWKEGIKHEAVKKITVPPGRLIVWEKEDGTAITDETYIQGSCTIRARSVPDTADIFIIEPPLSTPAAEHVLKGRKADPIGEITIPEGVTKIDEKAFANCIGITKVNFPASLKKIYFNAFENCTGITGEVDMSPCTQLKEVTGFKNCPGITGFKAPAQVTSIGFYYCTGLTSEVDLSAYTQLKNVTFIGCPNITGTKLPSSVKAVNVSGGTGIHSLADLNLPASIEMLVCKDCTGLTGLLDLSPYTQMKRIWSEAFEKCTGITDIKLPAAIEEIWRDAFTYCSGLTELDLSAYTQLKTVSGFILCNGLTSVKLPASVTSVYFSACPGLHNFAELNIPASVKYVYFHECGFTGEVDLSHCTQLTSIPQCAFDWCEGITAVKLPENIKDISPSSFRRCRNLRSIEINSVKQDSKDKPKLQFVRADSFEDVPADARFTIKVRESNAALKQQMAEEIKQLLITKAGISENQITIAE